jgi:acyl-CoA reductase-like NAD-dependent aldehyde dehydrogenase
MERFDLLIDGKMVAGDQTMKVINPATEEAFADCPRASLGQLNQAVAGAKAAFPAWAATPIGRTPEGHRADRRRHRAEQRRTRAPADAGTGQANC